MLTRTLFLVALLVALAETFLHGAHALAQVALRRAAALAVHDELIAAATAARQSIAAAAQSGEDPQQLAPATPAPVATCVLANASGCALSGSATVAFAVATPAPSPCPSDRCTVYEQNNDAVAEGRIDATISAAAVASDGVTMAARNLTLAFRTMRTPPYAAPVGALDATLGLFGTTRAGDDAGAAPNGTAPGSLIDVLYENAATGATLHANVWEPRSEGSGPSSGAWSP